EVLRAEVCVRTLAPSAHKIVVEGGADRRTDDRDQSACPLLHKLRAGAGCDLPNDARHEAIHHILFQIFSAQVHTGCTGGGDPELRHFVVGVVLKPIEQAELLNRAQGDSCKNAEIRHDCEQATEAQTGALGGGNLHSAMNDVFGDLVQNRRIHQIHSPIAGDRKTVSRLEFEQKTLRIHSDGLISAKQGLAESLLDTPTQPGSLRHKPSAVRKTATDYTHSRTVAPVPLLSDRNCWTHAIWHLRCATLRLLYALGKTASGAARWSGRIRHELHGGALGR